MAQGRAIWSRRRISSCSATCAVAEQYGERVALLAYRNWGEVGCWPLLLARVGEADEADEVVLRDFELLYGRP